MNQNLEQYLELRSERVGECLVWTKGTNDRGYGVMRRAGKTLKVHRVAYEVFIGQIPVGLDILHTCDNPPCFEPTHLFPGTQADNNADCCAKGRHGDPVRACGVTMPNAKLTDEIVMEILERRQNGETIKTLADDYEVAWSLVQRVCTGKSWTHVSHNRLKKFKPRGY